MKPDELNYSAVIFPEMWCESSRLHHYPTVNVLFLHGQWFWSNPFYIILHWMVQFWCWSQVFKLFWTLDFMMTVSDLSPELANGSIYSCLFRLMEPDRTQTWIEFRGFPIKQMSVWMCVFVGLTARSQILSVYHVFRADFLKAHGINFALFLPRSVSVISDHSHKQSKP